LPYDQPIELLLDLGHARLREAGPAASTMITSCRPAPGRPGDDMAHSVRADDAEA